MPQSSGKATATKSAVEVIDSTDKDATPLVELRGAGGPVFVVGCPVLDGVTGSEWFVASPSFVEQFYNKVRAARNIPKGVGQRQCLLEPFSRSDLGRYRQDLGVPIGQYAFGAGHCTNSDSEPHS